MSPLDDLAVDGEPLDEAGSLLIQLVAAVDYLRRGVRPGFTVWDAFEEALRWQTNIDEDRTNPDPLLRAIHLSFPSSTSAAETLNVAIRHWIEALSLIYNGSTPWEIALERVRGWLPIMPSGASECSPRRTGSSEVGPDDDRYDSKARPVALDKLKRAPRNVQSTSRQR